MRSLIVGYGSIGGRHRDVLSKLYPYAKIDLVSAHSSTDTAAYRCLDDVEHLDLYDYYIIASQTSDHYSQLYDIDAAVSGKVILVEKPVFCEPQDFKSFRNRIYVGYSLRYHPIITVLRTLCSEHRFLTVNVEIGRAHV